MELLTNETLNKAIRDVDLYFRRRVYILCADYIECLSISRKLYQTIKNKYDGGITPWKYELDNGLFHKDGHCIFVLPIAFYNKNIQGEKDIYYTEASVEKLNKV